MTAYEPVGVKCEVQIQEIVSTCGYYRVLLIDPFLEYPAKHKKYIFIFIFVSIYVTAP
jgi:hypothetical protein